MVLTNPKNKNVPLPCIEYTFSDKNDYKFFCRENTTDRDTVFSCSMDDEYLLDLLLRKGDIVVDIGSHIGGLTIKSIVDGAKRVYAVELCKENSDLIIRNCSANGFSSKTIDIKGDASVVVVNKGIHSDDLGMYLPNMETINKGDKNMVEYYHRFIYNGHHAFSSDDGNSTFFESISLNTLLKDETNINIMKVDCEGAEWRAFISATDETLDKIDIIVGEFNPIDSKGFGDAINDKIYPTHKGSDLLAILGHKYNDITNIIKPKIDNEKKKQTFTSLNENKSGLYLYVLLNKKYDNIEHYFSQKV